MVVTGGETSTADIAMAGPGVGRGHLTDAGSGRPCRRHRGVSGWRDDHRRYRGVPGVRPAGGEPRSHVRRDRLRDSNPERGDRRRPDDPGRRQPHAERDVRRRRGPRFADERDAPRRDGLGDTGQTTTTDSLGRYHIDLPPGSYTVTAVATGYDTGSGPVLINGGSYATLDFNLTPTGSPSPTPTPTPTPSRPRPRRRPHADPDQRHAVVRAGGRLVREIVEPDLQLRDRHGPALATR